MKTSLKDKLWTFSMKIEYFSKKHEVTMDDTIEVLCELWFDFENPRVVDNLIHFRLEPKPMFVEICDTKFNRGRAIPINALNSYCEMNQKKDQHIGLYSHDKKWMEGVKEKGRVSGMTGGFLGLPALWLELDRKTADNNSNLNKAISDALDIKDKFKVDSDCTVWWSGNNSTHISINPHLFGNPLISPERSSKYGVISELAHRIAGDVRYHNGVTNIHRESKQFVKELFMMYHGETKVKDHQFMAQVLENIDIQIYNVNSLIRQPYSYHEKGGQKIEIARSGRMLKSSNKLDFDKIPPYFIKAWLEAYKASGKDTVRRPTKNLKTYSDNEIARFYSKIIPDFDLDHDDGSGWAGPYYNPFYEDSSPSCYVDVETGYFKDHGTEDYSLKFNDVKKLYYTK